MWRKQANGCRTAPFPEIPDTLRERFSLGKLSLRPFGLFAEDREVDFTLPPRPLVETQILQCCTREAEGAPPVVDFFWKLEVSKRTQCLLIIAALSEKAEQLTIDLQCSNSDCHQEMELEFSIPELTDLQRKRIQSELSEVYIGTEKFAFRRPTGNDQLQWLGRSYADEKDAAQAMAETLVVGNRPERIWEAKSLSVDWVQSIDEALAGLDPLVNFGVRVRCPDCGREDLHSMDLGALALDRLRHAQDRLFETVHALATWYHWTEQAILAMPPWLRTRYLTLIDRETNNQCVTSRN